MFSDPRLHFQVRVHQAGTLLRAKDICLAKRFPQERGHSVRFAENDLLLFLGELHEPGKGGFDDVLLRCMSDRGIVWVSRFSVLLCP